MKRKKGNLFMVIAGLCVLVLLGGCATHQARSTEKAEFLKDYSQLTKGDKAQLRYVDPLADFKSYKSILMDPVKLFASTEHRMDDISSEEWQALLNYLDAAVREHLAKDYTFVQKPGPGVMRLRIALTQADRSNVPLDTISTVLPIGLAISALKSGITGKHSFVGAAGIEAELQDSQTGKRLAAAVDHRVGSKITGEFNKFDEWHTVKDSIDYWTQNLQDFLAEQRAKLN
jgi:hypothetical protein